MKISISENKKNNCIAIKYYSINFSKVEKLLEFLKIKLVSIFFDNDKIYKYYKTIEIDEFINTVSKINDSLLILDGRINDCNIDNEIEVFKKSKILVNVDIGENFTNILINTKFVLIDKNELKHVLI